MWQRGWLHAYQVARVAGFLDQGSDLQGVNYNLNQSQIAIGSGQLTGRGLFQGSQTRLSFVPAQTTDFIFTTIGEQMGFIGGAIVIGSYALLIWRILIIANGASDRFGGLICVGVASFLSFHIFINIGMTIGVAPVTGLPLPFISVGGSAMLSMAAALGLVNSVWRGRSPVPGQEYVPIRARR
jgi:rod shape determining protein RodA